MKKFKYFFSLLVIAGVMITSCTKEVEPEILSIVSIEAVGTSFEDGSAVTSDLNGVSSAANVALNATITVTFDREVDGTTVSNSTFSLETGDGDPVSAAVSGSGSSVTVNPESDFERGTTYTLSMGAVKASDGGSFSPSTRSFVTEGRKPVVVPNAEDMIAYWSFDGTSDDATGNYNPDNVVAIEFGDDRFGQGNSTASFDGDESIIEIPNGDQFMSHGSIAISFWMKTNSTDHVNENGDPAGYFVFGLGAFQGFQFEIPSNFNSCKLAMAYEKADGTLGSQDLWFPGTGNDASSGGFSGWEFDRDLSSSGGVPSLIADKWVHIVLSYSESERKGQMFMNGELMKSQDFDSYPDTNPFYQANGVAYNGNPADVEAILALGFIKSIDSPMWADTPWGDYAKPTSNHFKGDLDDFRIFSAPLSESDVTSLYESEKP